jgi:AbrB family looped-hinge helix DNA binding protein
MEGQGECMRVVRVSREYQIDVPDAVREELGMRAGDRLLVEVCGNHILLMPEPEDYARKLSGLHAEVWEGIDPREYVQRERDAWTD